MSISRKNNTKETKTESTLDTTCPVKKDGSLLRLFQSELFDIYFHMYYLFNRAEPGIQDYLVNLLYRRSEEDITFYLPQLCCLCLVRYNHSTLDRFLLKSASKSMNFALKVSWWFNALADTSNEAMRSVAEQLHQDVEMAIVNSNAAQCKTTTSEPSLDPNTPDFFGRRRAVNYLEVHTNRFVGDTTPRVPASVMSSSHQAEGFQSSQGVNNLDNLTRLEGVSQENCCAEMPLDTWQTETITYQDDDKKNTKNKDEYNAEMQSTAQDLMNPTEKDEDQSSRVSIVIPQQVPRVSNASSPQDPVQCKSAPKLPSHVQKMFIKPGFLARSGAIRILNSTVRLPSPYSKLGSPFAYVSFRDVMSIDFAMQQYIIKQRRCDYYNSVNAFVGTLIEVSNQLATEPNRSLRLPFLQLFLSAVNEWMFSRRCFIAALKGTFCMTGLSIPLSELMCSTTSLNIPKYLNSYSTQIVRFIPEECRVFSSKKRSPFLLVFEVADLDEDLYQLPFLEQNSPDEPCDSTPFTTTCDVTQTFKSNVSWDNLYVYGCILQEVKERNLFISSPEMKNAQCESPVYSLRRCMGFFETTTSATTTDDQCNTCLHARLSVSQDENILEPKPMPSATLKNEVYEGTHSQCCDSLQERNVTSVLLSTSSIDPQHATLASQQHEKQYETCNVDDTTTTTEVRGETSSPTVSPPRGSQTLDIEAPHDPLSYKNEPQTLSGNDVVPDSSFLDYSAVNLPASSDKTCAALKPTSTASRTAASAPHVRRQLWGRVWNERKEHYRSVSSFGHLKSWNLGCVLVKGGDDVRQEMLASQLVKEFELIFKRAHIPLYIRPYEVLVTGPNSGIMVFVPDTVSFDTLKKKFGVDSIAKVFECSFADNPYEAKKNFIQSHAAYSLVGYLLQVKDRHNGNYLLDTEGHVIHIDYGYMLSNSPGSVNFESSPFKLTAEFLDIMDGEDSDNFEYFRKLVVQGFLEIRKHADRLFLLVEVMLSMPQMSCFLGGPEATFAALKKRFMLHSTEEICIQKVNELIDSSVNNWRSIQYDTFQRLTNGIL